MDTALKKRILVLLCDTKGAMSIDELAALFGAPRRDLHGILISMTCPQMIKRLYDMSSSEPVERFEITGLGRYYVEHRTVRAQLTDDDDIGLAE